MDMNQIKQELLDAIKASHHSLTFKQLTSAQVEGAFEAIRLIDKAQCLNTVYGFGSVTVALHQAACKIYDAILHCDAVLGRKN